MLHQRSFTPLAGDGNALRDYKVADENQNKPEMGASTGNRSLSDRDMKFARLED